MIKIPGPGIKWLETSNRTGECAVNPKLIWYKKGDKGGRSEYRAEIETDGTYSVGRHDSNDIVLDDPDALEVSRKHAEFRVRGDGIIVVDSDSRNGTYLDGERIADAMWHQGERVEIGPYVFEQETQPAHHKARASHPPARRKRDDEESDGPKPTHFSDQKVSYASLAKTGRIEAEVEYLALGGGVGSFIWVDHLRVFGVPASQIRAVGVNETPYRKYEQLCEYSQIPKHERLRSNAISTPDNVWGFPGYASRETWKGLKRGRLGELKHIFTVFGEPTLAISYVPRAGDVFASLDREIDRIGWRDIWRYGRIEQIRMTDDGRYVAAYTGKRTGGGSSSSRVRYLIGRNLHLSTGYPGSQFLPDLMDFKRANRTSKRVFNAYEPPEGQYEDLAQNGGTVVVRGRGIVATRVIQKLTEIRRSNNANVQILHLMRSPAKPARYDLAQRPVWHNVEIQPFNWPKSCWGGSLRVRLEKATPEGRASLMRQWGGTTTAERHDWDEMFTTGAREGWYQAHFGTVRKLELSAGGKKVKTMIESRNQEWGMRDLEADYVIDCTGLISELRRLPLLRDLIDTYNLPRNKSGAGSDGEQKLAGLAVSNSFEIEGLRNGQGRAYAAGVVTANGPYAAVDSFLGLQYAALRSVDHLRSVRAAHVSGFGPLRSFGQWLKWCSGSAP